MTGLQEWEGLAIYWAIIGLMMTGLYALIARDNLIKKIMGLSLFQSSAILFYITMAKVSGGTAPILVENSHSLPVQSAGTANDEHAAEVAVEILYSNPLPHVLMLTAIVVGVATLALALALVVRIQDRYGSTEEDEIVQLDVRDSLSRSFEPVSK